MHHYRGKAVFFNFNPDLSGLVHVGDGHATIDVPGEDLLGMLAETSIPMAAIDALKTLGALPEGYCFCPPETRDATKAEGLHTGECLEAREVIRRWDLSRGPSAHSKNRTQPGR